MKFKGTDYRKLLLNNMDFSEYRHLRLLLYWPVFGLLFLFVERVWTNRPYVSVQCALDHAIPFCAYFLIPYLFWFVYLIGTLLYTFLFDVDAFNKMMHFIIITYSIAMMAYLLFPTEQNLRPEVFAHPSVLTALVSAFYQFDTNTNVCPSIHVIGSFAVLFAAWHSRRFGTPGWRAAFTVTAVLICVSTLFLKQHSILDLLAALPVCLVGYLLVYRQKTPDSIAQTTAAAYEGDLK